MSPLFFNSFFRFVQYIILQLNVSSHPPVYEKRYKTLWSAAAKDMPGVLSLVEKVLPVVVLGVLCDLFSASPSSRVCSPDNLQDRGFLLPPTGNYSILEWKICALSRGTSCAGDRPRTTSSGKVACNLP
jgi:hypothetical protein